VGDLPALASRSEHITDCSERARDRKTVRQYLEGFERLGLVAGQAPVERQRFYGIVESLLPARTQRPSPGGEQLLRYKEELRELINRNREPLKPKTAFTVVKSKYKLKVSYETFKRVTLLPQLIDLARKTRRIILENLGWAFAYNLVALPMAALVLIRPIIAAVATACSSLLVVSNSLRLKR